MIEKRVPKSREATHVLSHSSITEVNDGDNASLNKNHSRLPSSKELTQVSESGVENKINECHSNSCPDWPVIHCYTGQIYFSGALVSVPCCRLFKF